MAKSLTHAALNTPTHIKGRAATDKVACEQMRKQGEGNLCRVTIEHSRWTEQVHRPETEAGGAGSSNNKVVGG